MIPTFSFNNTPDVSIVGSELFSQSCAWIVPRNIEGSYFYDIFFCEFCLWEHFSFCVSVFSNAIMIIISSISNKQMFRINTFPNIAFVTNAKSILNLSFMEFIGKSMGERGTSKKSISLPTITSSPKPTGRSFIDIFPKSLYWSLTVSKTLKTSFYLYIWKVFSAICTFLVRVEDCHMSNYTMCED